VKNATIRQKSNWLISLLFLATLITLLGTGLTLLRVYYSTVPTYPNTYHRDEPIRHFYRFSKSNCFGVHIQNITSDLTKDSLPTIVAYYEQVGIIAREPHLDNSVTLFRDSEVWWPSFYYSHSQFVAVTELENGDFTRIWSQGDFYLLLFSSGPYSSECQP
jgi:hypothetical protein